MGAPQSRDEPGTNEAEPAGSFPRAEATNVRADVANAANVRSAPHVPPSVIWESHAFADELAVVLPVCFGVVERLASGRGASARGNAASQIMAVVWFILSLRVRWELVTFDH